MEPGLIIGLVLLAVIVVGVVINVGFKDRSGALDDDKSSPIPVGARRGPRWSSGERRDHDW